MCFPLLKKMIAEIIEHHFKKWYLIFTEVYKNKACPLEFTTFLSDDLYKRNKWSYILCLLSK